MIINRVDVYYICANCGTQFKEHIEICDLHDILDLKELAQEKNCIACMRLITNTITVTEEQFKAVFKQLHKRYDWENDGRTLLEQSLDHAKQEGLIK